MASVRLENLTKDFGDVRAVDDLSLEVADGEFVVVLGPSGAGKTTTLKLIAGVETPTSGKVYLDDKLMNAVEPHHRNVAMAFESYALYPHKTVKENIAFPLKAPGRSIPTDEIDRRVGSVAEMLNIQMLLDRLPQQLSNGQKQRVALGRAMIRDPQVLLLDEPISHLDAKLRHRMRTEFKALEAEIKTTTVYVTHDYVEAMSLAHRVIVINQGKLLQVGTPEEVFVRPTDMFVATMSGQPRINLIQCRPRQSADTMQLISDDSAIKITLPAPAAERVAASGSTRVVVGIRPFHMYILQDGIPETGDVIDATVYVYERLGTRGVLTVRAGKNQMDVITPIELDFRIDEQVRLGVDGGNIQVFDADSGKNLLV